MAAPAEQETKPKQYEKVVYLNERQEWFLNERRYRERINFSQTVRQALDRLMEEEGYVYPEDASP
jgi:hypothetical protein